MRVPINGCILCVDMCSIKRTGGMAGKRLPKVIITESSVPTYSYIFMPWCDSFNDISLKDSMEGRLEFDRNIQSTLALTKSATMCCYIHMLHVTATQIICTVMTFTIQSVCCVIQAAYCREICIGTRLPHYSSAWQQWLTSHIFTTIRLYCRK